MKLEEPLKGLDANQGVDSPGDQYASSSSHGNASLDANQGSIPMPRALRQKIVDEVWRYIQQGHNRGSEERSSGHEKPLTLGEMTLGDFLVKAGVIPEGSVKNRNNLMENTSADPVSGQGQKYGQGSHWLHQRHQKQGMDQQTVTGADLPVRSVPRPNSVGSGDSGQMMDAMYPEGQTSILTLTVEAMSDPKTPGHKRGASSDMADKFERRKRMMKNRASARSRARKQTVTRADLPSHSVPRPNGVGSEQMMDAMYPEGQMSISIPAVGAISDPQTAGCKRGASSDMADKFQRRQKRMMKNRASAARSRARKQAYTNELEKKVSRLEEENERLKKQKPENCIRKQKRTGENTSTSNGIKQEEIMEAADDQMIEDLRSEIGRLQADISTLMAEKCDLCVKLNKAELDNSKLKFDEKISQQKYDTGISELKSDLKFLEMKILLEGEKEKNAILQEQLGANQDQLPTCLRRLEALKHASSVEIKALKEKQEILWDIFEKHNEDTLHRIVKPYIEKRIREVNFKEMEKWFEEFVKEFDKRRTEHYGQLRNLIDDLHGSKQEEQMMTTAPYNQISSLKLNFERSCRGFMDAALAKLLEEEVETVHNT